MDTPVPSTTKNDMQALREGIRSRYRTYHQADPDRFPILEFNTNRANYIPLRDSFEEEFYRVRGYDKKTPTINIPSTNTLAQLFTDNSYLPGKKMLNTCYSYAEGYAQATTAPNTERTQVPAVKATSVWIGGGMLGVLVVGVILFVVWQRVKPTPGGLVIKRPTAGSSVPRNLIIEGKVDHAKTVWIVVRSKVNNLCWVQKPIQVNDTGGWVGVVYVGSNSETDQGYGYQIRAFVNPKDELHWGDKLTTWPQAELATNVVDVVRTKNLY
ncbi:hypothetical protein [Fibrella aquatilis]|uniref:Uncharacterized protein n=1 Tax=Fibrella aquatilis TaxID=2817059 RepID=A0A939GA59_9BACT|nr:hypothetical protein [Fibrella aquatilis]MBO0933815.1 hypothetical protein [Fibrella aquatilis]